jgi:hypothetical protein
MLWLPVLSNNMPVAPSTDESPSLESNIVDCISQRRDHNGMVHGNWRSALFAGNEQRQGAIGM